jgi:hypothetical protein
MAVYHKTLLFGLAELVPFFAGINFSAVTRSVSPGKLMSSLHIFGGIFQPIEKRSLSPLSAPKKEKGLYL